MYDFIYQMYLNTLGITIFVCSRHMSGISAGIVLSVLSIAGVYLLYLYSENMRPPWRRGTVS